MEAGRALRVQQEVESFHDDHILYNALKVINIFR